VIKLLFQKFSQNYSGQATRFWAFARQSDFAYTMLFYTVKECCFILAIAKWMKQKLHLENARIYIQGQNLSPLQNTKVLIRDQGTGLPPMRA